MKNQKQMLNKLQAWLKIEYLTPHKIRYSPRSMRIQKEEDVPWIEQTAKNTIYTLYIGVFCIQDIIEVIQQTLGDQSYQPEKIYDTTALAELMINSDGKYIPGTLHLSTAPYAVGLLTRNLNKFNEVGWEDGFQNIVREANSYVENLLESEVVTVKHLFLILRKLNDLNGWKPKYDRKPFWYTKKNVKSVKSYIEKLQEQESDFLNSFFIPDIEKVIAAVENGKIGEGLSVYLNGISDNKRIDIDRNKEFLSKILSPDNIPVAKWPDKNEHTLNLMQQVAVNLALKCNSIFSVNGPPGTGKTTLLREIIANIVVERAKCLSKFKDPQSAFHKLDVENSFLDIPLYRLDESLTRYKIVVASGNNNAVENISKELPDVEAIDTYYKDHKGANYFQEVAENLFEKPVWGLISAPLGNSKNRSRFIDSVCKNSTGMSLKRLLDQTEPQNWDEARKSFEKSLNKVFHEIKNIKTQCDRLEKFERKYCALNQKRQKIYQTLKSKKEQKAAFNLQKRNSFLAKTKFFLIKAKNHVYLQILELRYRQLIHKVKETSNELKHIKTSIKAQGIQPLNEEFWELDNSIQQKISPWVSKKLTELRAELFLEAINLHQTFIQHAKRQISSALKGYAKIHSSNIQDTKVFKAILDNVFLLVPVISTTFASLGNMFKLLGKEDIDWLIIDEAGQAVPQAAVGGIWRAKRTIVVGDPFQLPPVVTIPKSIIDNIARSHQVDSKYVSYTASVQTIADLTNRFGKFMGNEIGNKKWIGSPLWVHRRCIQPMFDISNKLSYDGNMVLATKTPDESFDYLKESRWLDVQGTSNPKHYIPEQGEVVLKIIRRCFRHQYKEYDSQNTINKLPSLYVISPFKSVESNLKQMIEKGLNPILKNFEVTEDEFKAWLKESIGTIHTFQGKEADIVILCLGVDKQNINAARWAVSSPNLLNVAVSRAKYRFIVVGDYQLWSGLNYINLLTSMLPVIRVRNPNKQKATLT